MPLRRRVAGVLAAAALAAPLYWLAPALVRRDAPSFRDQGDFFYPLKLYTADRLRAGELPLWNPLSGTGEPWLANGQSGVFYPPTLLFLLPSPAAAGILFLLFHFGIAIWGMRRFLVEEGVSEPAALLGSVAFAASGFAASLSAFWNHFGAWAYLPGIAMLARFGVKTRGALLGIAILVGLQAMAGSPEISGATALVALALALVPRGSREKPWHDSRGRSVLRAAGGLVLGLSIAAWVLVPMGELALHSDRRGPLPSAEREPAAVSPAALVVASAVPVSTVRTYWLPSLFVGPLVLAAAAFGFVDRERRLLALVLAAVGAVGFFAAAAGPPGIWLRDLPPLDRIRYPEKFLALSGFALAGLAGLGLDALRFRGRDRGVQIASGLAAAASVLLLYRAPFPSPAREVTLVGVTAVLALSLGWARRPAVGAFLAGTAALALVASLALSNRALFRFAPEQEIRRRPPALDGLGTVNGRVLTPPPAALTGWVVRDGRFDANALRRQREALFGYTNLLFGVSTVRTAAALPTAGARQVSDTVDASGAVAGGGPASARVLWTPLQPTILPSRRVQSFFRAPLAPYRPRLSFARAYEVEPDPARAWRRVASGGVDIAWSVLLDREPYPAPPPEPRSPILVARLVEDRPERMVAEIASNTAGILVVTDLFYPGWIAEAGGQRLEILRADGFFRAVALKPGSHRVTFRYRPLSFFVGAGVSVAALLIVGLLALRGEPVAVGRRR